MSVTRALVELKNLDKKITQAIATSVFVGVTVGKDANKKMHSPSGYDVKTTQENIQSSFDKVNQLIENRQRIKSAVVLSNAATMVDFAGKKMSVAEVIETKTSLPYKENFLGTLMTQTNHAKNMLDILNTKLNEDIDKALAVVYGNDKGKVEAEMFEQVAEPRRKQKEAALFDPAKVDQKVKSLQDEIQTIKSELDFVLAEINAKTEIEVEYD